MGNVVLQDLTPVRHESPVTTHHYVEADLTMKERALAKLHEPDVKIQRYRAPDSLLDFLKTL